MRRLCRFCRDTVPFVNHDRSGKPYTAAGGALQERMAEGAPGNFALATFGQEGLGRLKLSTPAKPRRSICLEDYTSTYALSFIPYAACGDVRV